MPGKERDAFLLRVIGSLTPMQNILMEWEEQRQAPAKVVILSPSTQPDHDVDYLFGQISIDKALVDWSGNWPNLSAAVGLLLYTLVLHRTHPQKRNCCGQRSQRSQHKKNHRHSCSYQRWSSTRNWRL